MRVHACVLWQGREWPKTIHTYIYVFMQCSKPIRTYIRVHAYVPWQGRMLPKPVHTYVHIGACVPFLAPRMRLDGGKT